MLLEVIVIWSATFNGCYFDSLVLRKALKPYKVLNPIKFKPPFWTWYLD
jgi:hypothetical protein